MYGNEFVHVVLREADFKQSGAQATGELRRNFAVVHVIARQVNRISIKKLLVRTELHQKLPLVHLIAGCGACL